MSTKNSMRLCLVPSVARVWASLRRELIVKPCA
eukprot:CAMPEP_0185773486 /NCGR_PEP_ID=MMETSP1174-20130828/73762_1 /TAXON_ID=35687 /ORGANISM="Dictyocha speculum, Strain CCMP1381" /LENGTH=32 /DNA_ID= /DNA_START= /DNA_END= /DNA_ORIENTATION=